MFAQNNFSIKADGENGFELVGPGMYSTREKPLLGVSSGACRLQGSTLELAVEFDYARMMQIVFSAGYHKYVGVEYEGSKHTKLEGTEACVKLLKTMQAQDRLNRPRLKARGFSQKEAIKMSGGSSTRQTFLVN